MFTSSRVSKNQIANQARDKLAIAQTFRVPDALMR
jgi:hypothetical protein